MHLYLLHCAVFWPWPLRLIEGNLNVAPHNDMVDNSFLSTLWEQFLFVPFLFMTMLSCTKPAP